MLTAAAAGVGKADSGHDSGGTTFQAVDYWTPKEAPPQPEPPVPPPGPIPPVTDADDVKRVLDPLQIGGRRGPNGVGTNPEVVEAWGPAAIKQMWDYLTRNAEESVGPQGFKGPVQALPDGTRIGLRQSTQGWGDTIQVWYPDGRLVPAAPRTWRSMDLLIAATAHAHSARLYTRHVADFVGLENLVEVVAP